MNNDHCALTITVH